MSKEFIAHKLKEYREKKGMSVPEIATLFNKSIKTIYAWESGYGQPDADTLIQLCLLYDIKSFDILTENNHTVKENEFELTKREKLLLSDFRNLSEQGQDYILQTMDMVKDKYKKDIHSSSVEDVG